MAWPMVSRDTKIVSWLGATVCVAIWRSRDAIQRCDMAAACCDTAYDMAGRMGDTERGMGLGVTIQFCIATRGGNTAGGDLRHDTQAPRYGALRPTTRLPARAVRMAWAQCARSLGLGCASCAPNPVLTQDTVLSHCFNHYS